MFILTCPSCSHTVRVKFARMGATATCPSCRERYTLTAETAESEAGEAIPPPVEGLPGVGRPSLHRRSRSRGAGGTALRRLDIQTRRLRQHLDPRLNARTAGVVGLLITAGLLGMLLVLLLAGGGGDEAATPPPSSVAQVSPAEGQAGDGPAPNPDSPSNPAQREPESTPETDPPPTVPAAGSALPELEFGSAILRNSYWTRLTDPAEPIRPHNEPDVLLWTPRVRVHPDGDRAMFTGLFLSESDRVYDSAFLHVQLLDEDHLVYAELKQVIPILCGRVGLQVRMPLPVEYLEEYTGLVAELTPIEPVEGGVPIEMVESYQERLGGGGSSPVLQLAVFNPHDTPVAGLEMVVEVLTPDGWPIGQWRGRLDQRIPPREVLLFRVAPNLPIDAAPGRVVIRGYAHQTG